MATAEGQARKLQPGTLIELYELDLTPNGGPVYFWHNSTASGDNIITFGGNDYFPYPIKAEGFEWTTQGTLPRPKVAVSNVTGLVSGLLRAYDDFVGCIVTRRRTFSQFIVGGSTPDNTQEYPPDVFAIDRRSVENNQIVEFELGTRMDVERVMLPRRQIIANACQWKYRGTECGYTGPPVTDQWGGPIGVVGADGHSTINDATFSATVGVFTGLVGKVITSPGYLADLSAIVSVGPGTHTVELSKVALATGTNIPFTIVGDANILGAYIPGHAYEYGNAVYTLLGGIQQWYFCIKFPGTTLEPPTNTEFWYADQCPKDLRGCKYRFGSNGVLPTAAFPGSSRIPK